MSVYFHQFQLPLGPISYKPPQFDNVFDSREPETASFIQQYDLRAPNIRRNMDRPFNALILRADIHAQFDKYQFSFDTGRRIQCFEKSGAPSIQSSHAKILPCTTQTVGSSLLTDAVTHHVEDVNPCLLWHIGGGGRHRGGNPVYALPKQTTEIHIG
ncbi:hypothetical protein ARMGADRAFT_1168922 [Armillaria gallica]|uniref:HNH nuclease domain-containing protein n=1 Tax=Armillaria gallica TaxID=47427 RepID=A0A2H3DFP0_ARMGA|nr:hypothetical protein ARMGADRAFT_1168922 [Armillaria gallica]